MFENTLKREKNGWGDYVAQPLNCGDPLRAFPIETALSKSEVKL
jgi:hypothetical protein